ncbi:TPA: hypothetical protein ACOD92_000154 [Stenotrophomonas maltophilia]|uniref:hypothetical protein n=1 Tax=Stenotrophomonas maltophilia TaxID=40324 RepID=UPI0011107271|nr:hypothetical protein [Stenotrophomonas maltophilia]TIL19764.1 hypothetical protein E4420_08995 [Stenotrophomonas maltophilia]
MINAIERLPIMQRDLVKMTACSNHWQQQLMEVANSVRLGSCSNSRMPDDITCIFLHNLSMLDHPSEWMGDHRYEASSYVDQLHSLLMFGADPNAQLSNGRNLLDVLTVQGRYWRWTDVNENIPSLVLAAFSLGAVASADVAKAMILPVYPNADPQNIDQETRQVLSVIENSYLNNEVPRVERAAKVVRL